MNLNLVLFNFLRENEGVDVASTGEYFYQIYLPVIIWLVLVLILLVLLLKRFTFGKWSKDVPNPHYGESMGLPRGTFRSILTLTLLFVSVILELVSVHTVGFEDNVSEFLTAFQMMIAFYFGSKVMHHITSADKKKAELISEDTKERKEIIKTITDDQKEEREIINKKIEETKNTDLSINNPPVVPLEEEMYDAGLDEGIDENEEFDEEIEFGGEDPDAKG